MSIQLNIGRNNLPIMMAYSLPTIMKCIKIHKERVVIDSFFFTFYFLQDLLVNP